MGQTATTETGATPEVDAFRERVRELREKLERAQGARLDMPAPEQPAPRAAARTSVSNPQAEALPAAIEKRMIEATQRIEQLAARETDLTNMLRQARAELDASERRVEEIAEAHRIAAERAVAADDDTEQAKAVADGLRQQVDAQRKRIEALGGENRALQDRNERLATDLQGSAQRESDARNELKRLQHTFDALQESYDEVRRQKADIEEKLNRTSGRINEFETELMGQLAHLEGEYSRIEGVADVARREADEAAAERDRLSEENEVKDALLKDLRDELATESAQRAEELDKRRDINVRLETLQTELEGLQSRYAADLVALDAARQSAARFEKRAADLTEELQAQRRMMQQHEAAFAQMDSLFRSLDGRSNEPPKSATGLEGPAVAADEHAADAPAPRPAESVEAAVPTVSASKVPESAVRPVARVVEDQPAQPTAAAAPTPERIAKVIKPSRPVARVTERPAPSIDTGAATASARERLGKSLEALQALADRHKSAERATPPAADAPATPKARAVRVATVSKPTSQAETAQQMGASADGMRENEAKAERPVVEAPSVETPAPSAAETRDGFIMPKPRLIRRD